MGNCIPPGVLECSKQLQKNSCWTARGADMEHGCKHQLVPDAEYHAAVIQKHWRGYKVRKGLHDMQLEPLGLREYQLEQHTAASQAFALQQQPLLTLQQQEVQHQLLASCNERSCLKGAQPDVWCEATNTVIRNRGVLQAALANR